MRIKKIVASYRTDEIRFIEDIHESKRCRKTAKKILKKKSQRNIALEDRYWGQKAQEALKKGFLNVKEREKWLKGNLSHTAVPASKKV